ncbi:N-acylethanolamine-hydrolyzing acid amidase [Sciurus carolinensis]|uniref:N-acylethanolamine-hydrolyzing acid amidase n=1 Tax=Sciurus carolinensis TaxID=30640 RepID=A0AA41T4N6_SCICA|nr:N-acylethanolamine-hydrolyzing acid amidase [Sciurus carolinensis]
MRVAGPGALPALALLLLPLAGARSWAATSLPAPPLFNVSLDAAPELRWLPVLQHYDRDLLRAAVVQIVGDRVPKWVLELIGKEIMKLESLLPQPFTDEIFGVCDFLNLSLVDGLLVNLAYEYSACVPPCLTGNNLMNRERNRCSKNKPFPLSPLKLTLTIVASFVATLSESENFEAAVYKLAKTPLIANVYYIVGGTSPQEGVVITRNRGGPADIWPLDPLNGAWFRVETNYDHWKPVPKRDDRR